MDKSPDAFRTISEVADVLETPAHVLRFWESRFPQIKPVKRAGGRRYYRPSDVALLAGIKRLLHDEGLTIRGVQKILRDQGTRHVAGLSDDSVDLSDMGFGPAEPDDAALQAALAGDDPGDEDQDAHTLRPRKSERLTLTDAAFGAFDDPEEDALIDSYPGGLTDLPLFPAIPAEARSAGVKSRRDLPARRMASAANLASLIRSLSPGELAKAQPEIGLLTARLARLRSRLGDRVEGGQG